MNRILFLIFVSSFVLSLHAAPLKKIALEGTPTRAIQDLDGMLDTYLLDPKTPKEKEYNAELKKKVLSGTFDIEELCRLALDKHWDDLSRSKRSDFVDMMTQLLEKKAIFSKERSAERGSNDEEDYYITYEGDRFLDEPQKQALVSSLVWIPSENLKIELNYKVRKQSEDWKIYDVIVDDASLVENYRYQFDRIISQSGYEDLVRRMQSKLNELQAKEKKETVEPPVKKKSWFGCRLIQ